MQHRELYDRAQRLDRETDALRFKINGVADPAERASLQVQIDRAAQRGSDAWAAYHDAEYAQRAASAGRPTALATASSSQPAPSAAEIAARRQAASRDLWRRVIGKVNAEMFGRQTDSAPNASREGTSLHGKAPPPHAATYDSKAIWKKAVAEANKRFGSEPNASRTDASRGAPSDTGQKPDTKSIWSKAVAKANAEMMTGNEAFVR